VVPVAALCAGTPEGGIVAQALALRYYGGDLLAFFDEYLELTLGLHLRLWLRYGVALASSQQNTVLVLKQRGKRLRLLLRNHCAARIRTAALAQRWPQLAGHVAQLRDPDLAVDEELPLARMFIAGTLQLNIAVLAERYAQALKVAPSALHRRVRACVERVLGRLEAEGEQVGLARRLLMEEDSLYLKRLLLAGGDGTAPNFLRSAGR
jgi:siderophore synthetase component